MEMEPFEANFMFGIGLSRALHFAFWVSSYQELNDRYGDNTLRRYPGHTVVLSQVVSLAVLGNFLVHHMTSARKNILVI
jgi:hypothetical protein